MSDAAMREAMVRMATDAEFARRVRDEGADVARERGLTETELATLQSLDRTEAAEGPEQMVPRLSKSGLFGAGALTSALGHLSAAPAHSFVCDGHSFVCNGHALLCDGHAHAHAHAHGADGHHTTAGIQCDGHSAAGIQCNGHDVAGVVKCNAHAAPPVLGQPGVHSLLEPPAGPTHEVTDA
ncbi:hypothetical protein [Hamadaea tsunoensis]|uniref:hypothetical protein n=1 Tax=Hamadaea tsunoensis TaxID=53368 RepID=UPI00041A4354|nr:hypothetical protein [Hamadaea tsunoensis]